MDCYRVTVELIAALRGVVEHVNKRYPDLGDQLQRAATSVLLNLAESNGRVGKDRVRQRRIAAGSIHEVRACLDAIGAWGIAPEASLGEARGLTERVAAMLYRLTAP